MYTCGSLQTRETKSRATFNQHEPNPSPHPTYNVENTYPQLFLTFNIVLGGGGGNCNVVLKYGNAFRRSAQIFDNYGFFITVPRYFCPGLSEFNDCWEQCDYSVLQVRYVFGSFLRLTFASFMTVFKRIIKQTFCIVFMFPTRFESVQCSDRFQRVSMNGGLSKKFPLCQGVPQGSCLGPLLFIIYTRKLFDIVERHLPQVHCYADDTQLYVSFRPNQSADADAALKSMTDCISDVRSWMISDNLMLNDDKTEFLILGTRQQLAKVNIDNIKVGSARVSPVSAVRNLGSWFDSQLTMSSHISKLCSVAFYHLCNIRRIRKYLSQETAGTLVHAFITSRIDYCNSLLYGLPSNQLAKIQRVLNASARLVCNAPRFCHITPIMRDLHWLPIRARINFKVLLLTFKALHGLAPQYLQSLLSAKTSRYNLRGSNTLLLTMPSVKSKATLGDRAFAIAALSLWNSLPSELRSITCLTSFKAHLKTFLFRHAYT